MFSFSVGAFELDNIGGEFGVEYSSLREKMNWIVGLNYNYEELTVGFTLYNWASPLKRSNTFPFIGSASSSVKYDWFVNLEILKDTYVYLERYCEHWMHQSEEYEDYVGYKTGIKFSW